MASRFRLSGVQPTSVSDVSWPLQGLRGMAQPLVALFVLIFGILFLSAESRAQVEGQYWQCVAPSSANPQGAYCPVGVAYPLPTAAAAATVGGGSTFRSTTLTNSAAAVKASAGTVSFVYVGNLEAAAVTCYLHLYDLAAASVVVGTTVPKWSIALAATTTHVSSFPVPLQFTNAIAAAVTTTAGGNTACSPLFSLAEIVFK